MTDHSPHASEALGREHTQLEVALLEQLHTMLHRVEELERHGDLMQTATIIQKLALLQCLPEDGVVVDVPEDAAPHHDDGTRITRIRVLARDGKLDIEPA